MSDDLRIWKDQYFIYWHECDFRGEASLTAICNFLQETAWRHAEKLGFGYQDAGKINQFWVVVRWAIKMKKYPKWKDRVIVETWPRKPDQYYAFRDYKITTIEGEELGAATSTWMLLDATTHRPQKMELVKTATHVIRDVKAIGEDAARLIFPAEMLPTGRRQVAYSDVDFYGHVNNARYVEWTLNLFDEAFHKQTQIHNFQINFLQESGFGDAIDFSIQKNTTDGIIIKATRTHDGKDVFGAEMWE